MTIEAILKNGHIQPLEPLPADWTDGQELLVEQPDHVTSQVQARQWADDLETSTARLPAEEHDRFRHALDEIESESKEAVRRAWGLP